MGNKEPCQDTLGLLLWKHCSKEAALLKEEYYQSFVEGSCEEHPQAACVRGSEKVLAFEDTGNMHMATFF